MGLPGQIPHFLRVGDAVSDVAADHRPISKAQDPTRGRRPARPIRKVEWDGPKATHVPNRRGRTFPGEFLSRIASKCLPGCTLAMGTMPRGARRKDRRGVPESPETTGRSLVWKMTYRAGWTICHDDPAWRRGGNPA